MWSQKVQLTWAKAWGSSLRASVSFWQSTVKGSKSHRLKSFQESVENPLLTLQPALQVFSAWISGSASAEVSLCRCVRTNKSFQRCEVKVCLCEVGISPMFESLCKNLGSFMKPSYMFVRSVKKLEIPPGMYRSVCAQGAMACKPLGRLSCYAKVDFHRLQCWWMWVLLSLCLFFWCGLISLLLSPGNYY